MASKNKRYEAIPDVEFGVVGADSGTPNLEEKYPDANDQERAFLGKLDEAMEKAKPVIALPTFKSTDIGPPAALMEFLQTLVIPTIAFGISLGSAVAAAAMASPLAIALFPYYSCLLTFIASIIPMKQAFNKRVDTIFNNVTSKEKEVFDKVDGVSSIALGYVDSAENAMDSAFKPIRSKLDKATKLEKTLQKVDPDIDIPDPSDIEKSFNGFTGQIRGAMEIVTASVDITKSIPKPIASKENLFKYVFLPTASVFLILQLVAIYTTTHDIAVDKNTNTTATSDRFLEAVASSDPDEFATRLNLIQISIQTYLTTFVQMILAYIAALPAFIIIPMNKFIQSLEKDVNEKLDEYAGPTFQAIFVNGFGSVKTKMLEFIAKMENIEGPMEKAEKMEQIANLGGVADSMKYAVGDKAGANLAQRKEAAKKMGGSRFKKFGF